MNANTKTTQLNDANENWACLLCLILYVHAVPVLARRTWPTVHEMHQQEGLYLLFPAHYFAHTYCAHMCPRSLPFLLTPETVCSICCREPVSMLSVAMKRASLHIFHLPLVRALVAFLATPSLPLALLLVDFFSVSLPYSLYT